MTASNELFYFSGVATSRDSNGYIHNVYYGGRGERTGEREGERIREAEGMGTTRDKH